MVLAQLLATEPGVAEAVVLANGFLQLRLLPAALHRVLYPLQPRLVPLLRLVYPRLPFVVRQLGSFALLWGLQTIFLHREPAAEKRKLFYAYTNTSDASMILRLSAALEYAAPPDLSRAQVPALVLSSSEDHWMKPSEPRRLAALLPQGEQRMLSGAGHMAPLIVPDAFNREVLAFFHRVAAAAPGACYN
jgi:pimeloyl-ACP methyl ester carboxylesterase